MKKIYLPAIASTLLISLGLNAQQVQRCSTTDYLQVMDQQYPEYQQNRAAIDSFTNVFIQEHMAEKEANAVVTIPVVVHIVYQNATENISDARIQSQIAVLNEDYRRLNADAGNTPSVWTSIASDPEFEFCLATVDPSGNATTGITRTSTSVSSFNINDDGVKFAASGGIAAWPRDQYLNIWVCDLGGSLLGYATPPGGPAANDGVVINYRYFGRNLGAQAPFHLGRTATHEVGHWLNLEHIWGDDGNSCSGSDQVNDTPNQADENYGCPSFPTVSCSNGPNGDMFMNYMDYSDDGCMNLFTAGQKTRMQACINGPRASIKTSNKCSGQGGGGGGGCDTLSNWTNGDAAVLLVYGSPASGYLGGHNSYQDKAKAEKFTNVGTNKVVTKVIYGFGAVDNETQNSLITCTVWGNSGGSPGTELASVNVSAPTIDQHVASSLYSIVTFSTNPVVNNTFFAGIKMTYSGNYAYSLFTSTDGDQSPATAWEQLSDNSWLQFGTPNASNAEVSLAVFPVVCDLSLGTEEIVVNEIKVYPNPTSGQVQVMVPASEEPVEIKVYDMMGRSVQVTPGTGAYDQIKTLDLSAQPDGIYLIEVRIGNETQIEKIILSK